MKTMKRTVLVGASMFALVFGASAQVDDAQALQAYQQGWMQSHNVAQMTPAEYQQMKLDWLQSIEIPEERVSDAVSLIEEQHKKNAHIAVEQGLPADFPIKSHTGNPAADEAAFQLAKTTWIQNNQQLYNEMTVKPKMSAEQREQIRQQELNNQNY